MESSPAPSLIDQVRIPPDALFQEVGREAILLDLKGEGDVGLDAVGTRIWQHLRDHRSLRALDDAGLQAFAVEPTRLEAELPQHLGELAAPGLARIGSAHATPA